MIKRTSKSSHHKETNRYKFQKFSERISQINVDVIRKGRVHLSDEECDSYFVEGVTKWKELDCTIDFANFCKDVGNNVTTYTQVVHHKDKIITSLKTHLEKKESLAYKALLDLVVQLAKDLQIDFYQFFHEFFNIIVVLLDSHPKDTDLLEDSFQCLGYLFKFLWRYLLKDIKDVFLYYSSLLSTQRKDYIHHFAADSFAFLLRKVKDPDEILSFIFQHVQDHSELREGVGILLFEVMKGVKKQFHSSAEKFFKVLVTKLAVDSQSGSLDDDGDTVCTVLSHTVVKMAKHINKQDSTFVSSVLVARSQHLSKDVEDTSNENQLHSVFHLLQVWLKQRHSSPEITSMLCEVLKYSKLSSQLIDDIMELVSITVQDKTVTLEDIKQLISLVYSYKACAFQQIHEFTRKLMSLEDFDEVVLPNLVHYMKRDKKVSSERKTELLFLLTEVITTKKILPQDGSELLQYQPYELQLHSDLVNHIVSVVSCSEDFSPGSNSVSTLWSALICLPHIKMSAAKVAKQLHSLVGTLCGLVCQGQDKEGADLLQVVLSQAIITLVCLKQTGMSPSIDHLCQLIRCNGDNVNILQALELCFAVMTRDDKIFNEKEKDDIQEIIPTLIKNLTSPIRRVCSLSLSILVQLHSKLTTLEDDGVFLVCLQAERVPVTLHDYREKLKHLQQLMFLSRKHYPQVPLLYLLGNLYVNLSLLWEPVKKMIKSLAYEMSGDEFWKILSEHLKETIDKIQNTASQTNESVSMSTSPEGNPADLSELFLHYFDKFCKSSDKPNHFKHRHSILNALTSFADKAESKSRILSPILHQFIRNEYEPTDEIIASTQDLRVDAVDVKTVSKIERRQAIKSLVDYLAVFSKFKDPKSLYQEPKLKELYMKLLCHPDARVQQLSLDCVLTYKYKYLLPYQDNLKRVLEVKSFSDELVAFSLEEDTGIVNAEHREQFLPLLMKVLYGRILSKGHGGRSKKSMILRFLGGCQSSELSQFMELILEPVKEWTEEAVSIDVSGTEESLNLTSFVPLKKLQSILEVCSMLLGKLYHVMEPYLSSILHVILQCTARVTIILEQRTLVHPKHLKALRKLRQLGVETLTQFFSQCDEYKYTDCELEAMFHGIIHPVIGRLPQEGVYSPTGLLKLAYIWTTKQRFHPLLVYHLKDQHQLQVLGQIMNLLSAKQVASSVTTMTTDIIDNLLVDPDDEEDKKTAALPQKYINTGSRQCVLLPYIPTILQHLKQVIQASSRKGKQKMTLPMKELQILSKLSIFVSDGDQCDQLTQLLLPIVNLVQNKQELLVDLLRTIRKLVTHCKEPRNFIRPCSKLLSWLPTTVTRLLCCDIIKSFGVTDPSLQDISNVVVQLNAVDRRHLEEPDYTVRLSAFKTILSKIVAMETIDLDYILPVLNNCFYFISKIDDMSLRDNAVNILDTLIQKLSDDSGKGSSKAFDVCINQMILPAMIDGLSNKSEIIRHEYIGLLTQLVKTFPDNKKFEDLKVLRDDNIDRDFFENIKHLQHHRQMKALRLLVQKCEQNQLHSYSLKSFLLPTATSIIFDDNLSKNLQLVMDATAAVGAIAKCLPWQPYVKLLQQYLGLLLKETQQQKITVKLLMVILDGFHFNLASYKVNNEKSGVGDSNGDEDNVNTDTSAEDEMKYHVIVDNILPKLNKLLTQKTQSDDEHRSVRRNIAADNEIVRIPLAVAMVRLLMALPPAVCNQHLSRVIMKVCHSLKSRASDIREASRTTLIKIMSYLGTRYFKTVIIELQHTLTRGYQKHVLSYTIHAMLQGINDTLNHGDLDQCIDNLIAVCNEELFGEVAVEKEVAGITRKLREAQSSKSFEIYQIIGKYISAEHLSKVISTFKGVLESTHVHKTVHKVEDVLRRLILGLLENQGLKSQDLVIFIHGIITQTLPIMIDKKEDSMKKEKNPFERVDILLLDKTTQKKGPKSAVQRKTNLHVLVEFGLQLLFMLIKRSHLTALDTDHLAMLDPLLPLLVDSTQSRYIKVTTSSIQCLSRLLQFSLPQLSTNAARLAGLLFQLLKTHARSGTPKGDGLQLVQWTFKTMTVFLKTMQDYQVTDDQLHVLLSFVEEDIYDNAKQSTAFPLLKAILSRKLQCNEMDTVMKKVAELSITSSASNIRAQCRQLMSQFLLDYPLGKKIHTYLDFYVAQLTYDYEEGRKSALEMLAIIFTTFPQHLLVEKAGLFYVPMATGLVNDESAECRKLIALALKTLLDKLTAESRDRLFAISLLWLQDDKLAHRQLASQLIGLFVEVQKEDFEFRLKEVLPILCEQIHPDKYTETGDDIDDKEGDHLLFNLLTSFVKILQHCPIILQSKTFKPIMKTLWANIHEHILHNHSWVRLSVSQLYGQLFTTLSLEDVIKYLGLAEISQLVKDFCQQLHSKQLNKGLVDQIVKNLLCLSKILDKRKNSPELIEVDVTWLVKRLSQTARYERANSSLGNGRRMGILKWMAGLAVYLETQQLMEYLSLLLEIVQKELNANHHTDGDLKTLAQEVTDLLRNKTGVTSFTEAYTTVKTSLEDVRRKRHQQQVIQAVADPEQASRKKIKKHLAKREAKKRKILERKPYKSKKMKMT
ncbi:small subunit processome component 20 homolog [Glandiceps talaboti]